MKPKFRLRTAITLWWPLLTCVFFTMLLSAASINNEKAETIMQQRYGDNGVTLLRQWLGLISANGNQSFVNPIPEDQQLGLVNDFFNRHIRFEDDISHWKQKDYWATPLETLGSGAGDCEDYTIAKYISLIQLGVPVERLRLIYVKAQIGGQSSRVFQAHMVLGYYSQPNAIPLILDSLIPGIEAADKRTDLRPVFSFNSEGLWVGNQAQPQIDPTARLSRWRDVLNRMKQEGF